MSDDSTDDDWPEDPPRYREGVRIVQRYDLVRKLGEGTYGVVWEALDLVTERRVAVKLLHPEHEMVHARAMLEVAALRRGLPGVVELLDDGVEDGQAFLVMELVEGKPFPGADPPRSWTEIAPVVATLLEVLGRLHSAFVIHRDLKPTNVLVTPDRRVFLLDFGAAYRVTAGDEESIERLEILGTPAYMAPEQVRGQTISERTDIFTLGVMVYEALAGVLPNPGENAGQVLRARLTQPHVPLQKVARDVPANVARLVERMLSNDPSMRPSSAFEVLATLRGEHAVEESGFLWLGSRARFDVVLQAAREGRSVDVVGPRGSGRTRWLQGVEELVSSARRIHWVTPARSARPAPFEGFGAFFRGASAGAEGAVDVTAEDAEARVRAAIAAGDLFLADDFERLDPASRELIDAVRSAGGVVRALTSPLGEDGPVVTISPLNEADLRALFAGPDRLLHLREDAARLLHRRTSGSPARVVDEVNAWISLGIARRSFNVVTVSRDALDRLAAGVLAVAPPSGAGWSEERGREAHAAAARSLAPGDEGRLVHLVLAGTEAREDRLAIAREAIALATRLLGVGRLGAAIAAIETGVRAIRDAGAAASAERDELFALWLEAAFEEGAPRALDLLLHALYRAEPRPEVIASIAHVLKVEDFESPRAMDPALSIPPQDNPRLEHLRICALLHAARLQRDDAAEEALLDELARLPTASDPEIAARIASARGRLRYRQNRFEEAAELHLAAAKHGPWLHRIGAKNAAAWALLEAYDFDAAARVAEEARAEASEHRHPVQETHATWTLRAVAYREGTAGTPDLDLVAAVQLAAGRQIQGAILFTEAAIAFRAAHPAARALAQRSHDLLSAIHEERGALLMRCLLVALGEAKAASEVDALYHRALAVTGRGLGLQALGLLAMAGCPAPKEVADYRTYAMAGEVPRAHWGARGDILSVDESIAAILGRLRSPTARLTPPEPAESPLPPVTVSGNSR